MELGISKGRFSVIRLGPEHMPPDGGFILRIEDAASGITIVTHLRHEEGLELAKGFRAGENEQPAPMVVLPDNNEVRELGNKQAEAPA